MALLDKVVVVALFSFIGLVSCRNTKLKERFSWKMVDFEYPSDAARSEAIKSGNFIPENNLPLGVEVWKNKLFVTLPRWKAGIAASVTYIDLDATTEKSPKLKPYPNWEVHQNLGDNKGAGKITTVFRMHVDICDRLWMLDSGLANLLEKAEVMYPPKIVVYNLTSDQLLFEYTIPQDLIKETSFLANIISDVIDSCDNAYAYIPDLGSNALIVYNLPSNRAWRITHHYFHFDPTQGNYNIGGLNHQWTDGIFGVALSGPQSKECCHRTLYFHPMSSGKEFAVSTEVIQNEQAAGNYHAYKELGTRGPSGQSSSSSFHEKTGVLFYTLLNKNAVGCWNSKKEYSPETNAIVAYDNTTMIFPNDLKVDKNGVLWVLTDRLTNYWFARLNYDDVNFRIFSVPAEEAIKGTVCEKNSSSRMAAISMLIVFLAGILRHAN